MQASSIFQFHAPVLCAGAAKRTQVAGGREKVMRGLLHLTWLVATWVLAPALLASALLGACAGGAAQDTSSMPAAAVTRPAQLDLATTQASQGGLYRISFSADQEPIPISKLHTWTVHVAAAEGEAAGEAVAGAAVSVEGGMPEHNHGLPTKPQVTPLGGGDYRVEGMKFQMPGWWTVTVTVEAGGQVDRATFNLLLN
jgi:hypothetical protein